MLQNKNTKLYKTSYFIPIILNISTIPIFISLYKFIYIFIDFKNLPFILWINDLSYYDNFNIIAFLRISNVNYLYILNIGILSLILSFTSYLQQFLSSKTNSVNNKNFISLFFFIFLFFFSSSFHCLLIFYWFFSNIFSILQLFTVSFLIKK